MDYSALIEKGVPNHIAIILDGNGRWAQKRFLPRVMGHRKGALNIRNIAKASNEMGIKYLTVFCFSTENWNRPDSEVKYLMTTPIRYYKRYKDAIIKSNIKINVIGRRDRINEQLLEVINDVCEQTKNHTGLTLTLCIDYGSQDEIITMTKNISKKVLNGEIKVEDIDKTMVEQNLFTSSLPSLDLLIRTSGELRISNFLLWQLAYSELYFTDTYWPAFDEKELYKAIVSFQSRKRRYGGLKEK